MFILLIAGITVAAPTQPGFDPKEVVRQVRGVERLAFDSGEFLIDTNVAYVPASNCGVIPSVAFDGTNYLVVWQEGLYRSGNSDSWANDIGGARVTSSGRILDPAGIRICTAPGIQGYPSVAFNGVNYLVVWEDARRIISWDIYGARVTPSGVVLDTAGIAISTTGNPRFPSVAADGTNYLVVWEESRSGISNDIYGARVSPSGVVLDPDGIAISTAPHGQDWPSATFDGMDYLVVWQDARVSSNETDIYGARVTVSGVVMDSSGIPISTANRQQQLPSVAFDGTNCLVVWHDFRSGGACDVYGARINRAGTVLDTNGIAISTAPGYQYCPSVAFDGTNYLAVWDNDSAHNIHGTRITPAGVVLDSNGFAISARIDCEESYPAAVFGETTYCVVWQGFCADLSNIYGTRVSPSGTVLDTAGITVSTISYWQMNASVGFDGTNYLVVWQDSRDWSASRYDIYGARVSRSGTVLDPTGTPISTAVGPQGSPAVSAGNINYLVVWTDCRNSSYDDIYGARVSQAGLVLDPEGIPISTAADWQLAPAVSFDGTNFLAVWQDRRGEHWDIYGTRVSQAGIVLDPEGIPISTAAGCQEFPAISFDGTNFLVVWTDGRSSEYDIYGARVSQTGTVLDPAGIPISTARGYQWYPAVSFDGTNYFAVWEDWRSYSCIYGARVSQAGTVFDPEGIPISTAAHAQYYPAVSFDGTSYLAVWQDYRSGSTTDIYGAKVSLSGAVVDSFPVSLQAGDQTAPALVLGTGNQVFVAYSGWADSINRHPANTMRIWGKLGPFPGVEETPNAEVRTPNAGPTIVRGVLCVPEASVVERSASCVLLDITGRKVAELQPGANDIRHLSPGVYFLRRDKDNKTAKVIIQK